MLGSSWPGEGHSDEFHAKGREWPVQRSDCGESMETGMVSFMFIRLRLSVWSGCLVMHRTEKRKTRKAVPGVRVR